MEIDTEKAAEARARILSEFERWLDIALDEEAPPEGLAANLLAALASGETLQPVEGRADLYSLWSAVTALTQEVKIQGRTFRQLNDSLQAQAESTLAVAPAAGPGKKLEKDQLDLLLDLRDRLDRGLQSVRETALVAPSRPWLLSRWLGIGEVKSRQTQEVLTALDRGYALTLQRLDQALKDAHVYPILCLGQLFDAKQMTAVELDETEEAPEGTVVGIHREGYEWNGQLYRAAQVKVARAPSQATSKGEKHPR